MSSIRLGSTYPPTDIETVLSTTQLTGQREPRTRFYEAGQYLDRLDGYITPQGYPLAVWTFDILNQTMVDTLRTYCTGFDATVYISTRIEDGTYQDFEARMIWPFKQMERRQFNGIYTGLEFQFRHLKLVDPEVDESEAVTVVEAVSVLLANYATAASEAVTVGESAAAAISTPVAAVSDSVTVGESVAAYLYYPISASEAVTVGESVSVEMPALLWLDGDDTDYLWQDAGKTTAVTSDADPVGNWEDKSGHGNDASQSTAGYRPLYKTNQHNSRAAIQFDGSDDILTISCDFASQVTMFMVINTPGQDAAVFRSDGTGNTPYFTYSAASDIYELQNWDGGATINQHFSSDPITSGLYLFVWTQTDGSGTTYLYENSTTPVDSEAVSAVIAGDTIVTIGLSYDTNICEIRVYGRNMGATERNSVMTELATKWGITLS